MASRQRTRATASNTNINAIQTEKETETSDLESDAMSIALERLQSLSEGVDLSGDGAIGGNDTMTDTRSSSSSEISSSYLGLSHEAYLRRAWTFIHKVLFCSVPVLYDLMTRVLIRSVMFFLTDNVSTIHAKYN